MLGRGGWGAGAGEGPLGGWGAVGVREGLYVQGIGWGDVRAGLTHAHLPPPPPCQDVAACEAEVTKKGVQAAAAEKAADKLGKEVAKARGEREALAAQQEATMQEFKALEEAAFRVLEAARETQALLGAKEGELGTIRAEFEAKQKEVRRGQRGGGGGRGGERPRRALRPPSAAACLRGS